MIPFKLEGSKYAVLGIEQRFRVKDSNGVYVPAKIAYAYGPTSPCESTPNGQGQKNSLVTTPVTGFQAQVASPLIASVLNEGYINNGIWARWLDAVNDPWQQVGVEGLVAGGGVGMTVDFTAVPSPGPVASVVGAPVAGGTGYAVGDYAMITGGGGTGAFVRVTAVAAGVATEVELVSPGNTYTTNAAAATSDFKWISGVMPFSNIGGGATITTTVTGGVIQTVTLVAGGAGYLSGGNGTVTLLIVGGMGGIVTATVTAGVVTAITLGSGGTGYTAGAAQATVTFDYNNPTGDGGIGTLASRMPFDNSVTVRKVTLVRGRNWEGDWKVGPLDSSFVTEDELNAVGQAAWNPMKEPLYGSITDGDATLVPILISASQSQLVRQEGIRVAYAQLVLPGIDPVTGFLNPIVNLATGTMRRRKEKKTVVF